MADLEVHGELRAGAAGVPDHAFTHDNHTVTVVEGNVSVRWRAASDVSAGSARAIHRWFENYLFAMSVASGSPGYVRWTGQTAHQPDGHTRGVASITVSWSTVRDHPGPFSTYQRLASDIGQIPEAATAAERVQTAMDLLSQDLEVAAGEAYKAVEAMARSHRLSAWKSFGTTLERAGLGKTATDLEMLWASSQLYRHDQSQAGAARKVLGTRPELDYGRCCWAAAEILEAYCLGKRTGAL